MKRLKEGILHMEELRWNLEAKKQVSCTCKDVMNRNTNDCKKKILMSIVVKHGHDYSCIYNIYIFDNNWWR